MASQTPIYEQFARSRHSIRSIQPVQQSPLHGDKHAISLVAAVPMDHDGYTHAHPSSPSLQRQQRQQRPQSHYYEQSPAAAAPSSQRTDLKHSRSQSHALLSIKRKQVENATPKRAQSVLQPQHIRVSHGSDVSAVSGVSTNADLRSDTTNDTSASVQRSSGYSHHAAVKGAVGYVPQEPVREKAAFSKKIVVVGDGGSGKTSLLMRYKERVFPDKYVPTVFENYITTKHHRGTNKTVELALWDTAGQEEYDRLRPLSYPETSVILICFAIDCPQSLDNIKEKWYPEVAHFCPTTPILLVACKSDLRENANCIDLLEGQGLRPTTADEGRAMATFIRAEAYVECSSKNMVNVDEIFEAAIDVSVANETGTDWSRGQVGQQMKTGRLGTASQTIAKPGGAVNGKGGAEYTKDGVKKRKKSRTCKIL